jgi:hypothetical protein
MIFAAVAVLSWVVFGQDPALVPFGVFGLLWCGVFLFARHQRHARCRAIRLYDDGTCELVTVSRVVPLQAAQIRSVRYHPATDERNERYTIHFDGGKVDVAAAMTAFGDFLLRLKTLNPGVDVSTFPAVFTESLPGRNPAPDSRSLVERFLRSALFPLFVVVLLIYLAGQTVIK